MGEALQIKTVFKDPELRGEQLKPIKQFEKEMRVNYERADRTRLHQVRVLRDLAKLTGKTFEEMEKEDILDYLGSLEGLATNTVNQRKVILKRFFRWLHGDGDEYPQVVKWIKTARMKNRLPVDELLTQEDILAMVEAAKNQRDRALVMVLWDSAIRAGEAVNMRIRHVSFDKYGAVIIVNGKTGQRRIRLVHAVPDLRLWLNMHPERDNPKAPLWINQSTRKTGEPIARMGIYQIVRALAERGGIKKPVTPHKIRHARLTELAREFTDSELKIIAGWEAASTMPGVYVHLSGADIEKKVLEKNGMLEEKEKEEPILKPKKCPACDIENPAGASFCNRCGQVLDLKTAMRVEDVKEGVTERERVVAEVKQEVYEQLLKELKGKGGALTS